MKISFLKQKTKINKHGCWEWIGAYFYPEKYGKVSFRINGKKMYKKAHRMVWEIKNGPIPKGLCILHRCDNPKCIRPKHLFIGTRLQNNIDRKNKNRSYRPFGDKNPSVKISSDIVQMIRKANGTLKEIAGVFGISKTQVSRIKRFQSWKHL